MSWLNAHLTNTITIWTRTGTDQFGKPTFSRSTGKGRREDRNELFIDTNKEEKISEAVVFTDTDIPVGSWIFVGSSTESDPTNEDDAREVQRFDKIPDLAGQLNHRKAFL